jgi:hypothetical protein
MALHGTLEDLNIVSLLQFPHTGRRTGLLVVESQSGRADLFYKQGALVNAATGSLVGRDALVEIVGWTHGSFSFTAGAEAPGVNLDGDLHRELMMALKESDERKKAEAESRARIEAESRSRKDYAPKLREAFDQARSCLFACVTDGKGGILASLESESRDWSSFNTFAGASVSGYPRRPLSRLLCEDSEGSTAVCELDNGDILLLVCAPGTNLGLLSRVLSRFSEESRT